MMELLREELNTVLLSLGLLAVLVYAVMRDRRNPLKWSKNARDPMDVLAERRNWQRSFTGPKPGFGRKSAAVSVIGDKDDPRAWEVVITSATRSSPHRSHADIPGDTIFRAPLPVFPRELVVFAGAIPATTKTPFDPMRDMAGMEERRLRQELRDMLGKTHQRALDALSRQPVPGGNKITVLATHDPNARFDVAEIARLLTRWSAFNPMTNPARLVIDEFGMMLYLREALSNPDAISAFVTLAFNLQATARGAQTAQGVSAPPPHPSENSPVSRSSLA
ncbi:MAG: hypothetical protein JJT99_11960 [Rhodobacteraceae bacterium]|nr:hypothetical protein [Paracoccaceae bacterium]